MSNIAIVNLFFGIISSALMVAIAIPQLIAIHKNKNVASVSYGTFLIYFIGGLLFVITMVLKDGVGTYEFDSKSNPNSDPIINILGNYLFLIVMSLTITSFLIYDKNKPFWFKTVIGSFVWSISLTFTIWIIMAYSNPNYRANLKSESIEMTALTVVATLCTSLPFTLQIYKTLKLKSAEGLSVIMLYLGIVLNATLLIYLATLLPVGIPMWYVCIIFQSIAILVYIAQIFLYYYFKNKNKIVHTQNMEINN
ncbi:PQ-loop repeat-containing protein [Mycoplasma tauri]|uniref:PQ-loop repeat-containing protein n=1 Tax=Mycoplasma tauri TaxID=547987 RepID=A0A953NCK0_9MOLU|nr:PQ-loop repeat-containing protein [Mycoplasma tauri]MBZ4195372.1 PQ-loop repeat-containing protein [Mycoplasma tauri]MBZ4203903.1 PQ-loop repeat-containing protein [Mycoplasma tauri]MBZ4204517.1 PQ-loop repeat-containing protein [Mycoplasma tauri]MBZ4218256.1 PQ-loop repeat-containing protein [Mycoplasma tauri]QSB07234.1 PQ-loop repeat-containing protein [Mycoplasma tauri]